MKALFLTLAPFVIAFSALLGWCAPGEKVSNRVPPREGLTTLTPAGTIVFGDRLNIVWISAKVTKFRSINGRLPNSLGELSNPRFGDVLHMRGKLPLDPIKHKPYQYRTPALSGAAFEIEDNGGLDPTVLEAMHYPGGAGDSLVYDSKVGFFVRKSLQR